MLSTTHFNEVASRWPGDVGTGRSTTLPFGQAALFADPDQKSNVQTVAEDVLSTVRFPWYAADEIRATALLHQPCLFDAPAAQIVRFHSGSSAYWDFRGYMLAGVPIGITATALPGSRSSRVIGLVATYTAHGGTVFVDSGAFGAFCAGRELDFEADVFSVYDQILQACSTPKNLHFVMPDVVGDPVASMGLQRVHADRIHAWMDAGVTCIFPLHSPDDSSFLAAIKMLAGHRGFTIGVPSNVAAWSLPQLLSFCAAHRPASIHMLGLGNAQKVQAIGQEVLRVSPQTSLSCDSCTLIAHAGQGRRLTDRCRTRLADAIDWVMNDPSACVDLLDLATFVADVLTEPGFLPDADVIRLAKHFKVNESQLVRAGRAEGLSSVLCPLDPDEQWLHSALSEYVRDQLYVPKLEQVLRGPIRAWEVARLAGMPDELEFANSG